MSNVQNIFYFECDIASVYMVYCWFTTLSFTIQMFIFGPKAMPGYESMTITDIFSLIIFVASTTIGVWMPIILAKAAASLDPEVSLCHDLKWPKHGLKLAISGLMTAIAQILVDFEYSMVQFEQYNATSTQIILYLSFYISSSLLATVINLFHGCIFMMIIERTGDYCSSEKMMRNIENASKCITFYQNLKQNMGKYIFITFAGSQLYLITAMHLSLKFLFQTQGAFQNWTFYSTCASYILSIVGISLILLRQVYRQKVRIKSCLLIYFWHP